MRESIRAVRARQNLNGMNRPPAQRLVEVQGGHRAIRSHDFRVGVFHFVERLLAGQHRQREEFLLHRPCAVVAAALVDQAYGRAGNQTHQVARTIADVLRLQVAGQVVADLAGRGKEVAVEGAFLLELKQVFAEVHGGRRHLARGRAALQLGVFLPQHVRAGRIDRHDLPAGFHVGQQRFDVRSRQLLRQRHVAGFERRHPAAILLRTGERDSVLRKHFDGVLRHLRIVVVHEAGSEQDGFRGIAGRRRTAAKPLLESLGVEIGQDLVAVDANRHFHAPSQQRLAVSPVGERRRSPAEAADEFRARQQALAQTGALFLPADRGKAPHQPRKIQLERVAVVGRVRALHVTELALVAGIEDALPLGFSQPAHLAVVAVHRLK